MGSPFSIPTAFSTATVSGSILKETVKTKRRQKNSKVFIRGLYLVNTPVKTLVNYKIGPRITIQKIIIKIKELVMIHGDFEKNKKKITVKKMTLVNINISNFLSNKNLSIIIFHR